MSKKSKNSTAEIKTEKIISYSWMFWLLGIVSFFLFANTLMHGFVLDDIAVIEQNKFVKNGIAGIPDILTTFYWQGYWDSNAGLYRPMSLISFAIEWQFMPNNPFIHHFCNVILYSLNILLLFTVLKHFLSNYTIWIPFFIVLLFAVHPIHTEVVANIKSRDEILCLLFFTITIYCLFCKESIGYFILGILSYLFCLLSKEAGILFFPILIVLFWDKMKNLKLIFKKILPFVVVSIAWLSWHQYIIQSSPYKRIQYTYLDNSLVGCGDNITQIATGFSVLGRYILNSIVPYNLSYDYSFNQIPCVGLLSYQFIGSLILISILILIAFKFRSKNVIVTFGIGFFFITILLVTNIFTLIGATMGDRLLYTPVLGICIAVVFIIFYSFKIMELKSYSHPVIYGLFVVTVLYSYNSFGRNKAWKSNFTLFTEDVNHAPNSSRVNFNNATALFSQLPEDVNNQQTQLPQIIENYEKALQIDPKDKGSLVNLGVCYYRIKEYQKALDCTKKALQINPNDITLFGNLADIYFMKKQYDLAILNYKKAIQNKSIQYNTYNFYGAALFNSKEYQKAIAIFEDGLKLYPEHDEMYLNYGNALAVSSRFKEAIVAFEKSYQLNPNQKNTLNSLSMANRAIGNIEKANYYLSEYNKR
ncbi:MAG: tetratricopeptide repeat protein [Flavobacterium sp.]|uniref:tetratricopeptide repeat protein n=1 Tax=Flavobacterium sp. TaxID=239 RepID=UPI0032630911